MKTLDYIYIAPNGKVDPRNFEIVQERLEQGWELLTIDNGIAYIRRIVLPETSCGPLKLRLVDKEPVAHKTLYYEDESVKAKF